MSIVDGQVYYRENSRMVRPDLNATAEARVKGLVGLRDCVQKLIDLQMDAAVPDSTIREKQAELNTSLQSPSNDLPATRLTASIIHASFDSWALASSSKKKISTPYRQTANL